MSIQGKKEGILRILGSFLILIGFILSIIFNIFTLNNFILFLVSLLIVVLPFLVSTLLKLEQDFIVKYSKSILFILSILIVILNVFTLPAYSSLNIINFVLIECSDLLLISCWHFSLSIYKREKIIFVLSGAGYFDLNIILWFSLTQILIITIFQSLIFYVGFFLIISAELIMKKKGLLNYMWLLVFEKIPCFTLSLKRSIFYFYFFIFL